MPRRMRIPPPRALAWACNFWPHRLPRATPRAERTKVVKAIKPAEGKTETVQAGLQAFIDQQKAAQEHYLEDQYAIAKNAKLGVMPGGEVVMVMCEDADTVYANIEKALK